MIYKVISKAEFRKFIDALVKHNSAFGPQERRYRTAGGKPIYQFIPVKSADEIAFDYSSNPLFGQTFLPAFPRRTFAVSTFNDGNWEQEVSLRSAAHYADRTQSHATSVPSICLMMCMLHGPYPSAILSCTHGKTPSSSAWTICPCPTASANR